MPFTFAHPAIVLPISKISKYFNITGLIAGSIAPDFEYFIRLTPVSTISHTIWGVIIFNVPIAFFISWLFDSIVKKPLIQHLPSPWDQDYNYLSSPAFKFTINSWHKLALFIFSIIIGALSHIFWDSFTHIHGYFVENIPALAYKIGDTFPIFKVLQHSSTLLGSIVMLWVILSLRHKAKLFSPIPKKQKVFYWLTVATFTSIILTLWILSSSPFQIIQVIVPTISGFLVAVLAASLVIKKLY